MGSFDQAINLSMRFEVGPFWDERHSACLTGSITTSADRKATGYVDDPDDTGGETKFGIAKNHNPDIDIASLTWGAAKRIYYKKYWLGGDCDHLPDKIAMAHLDACINHGIGRAARMLQEAVGATIDGDVGPKTLELVKKACAGSGGELAVLGKMLDIRRRFFRAIVQNKPSQGKFLNGWLIRCDTLGRALQAL